MQCRSLISQDIVLFMPDTLLVIFVCVCIADALKWMTKKIILITQALYLAENYKSVSQIDVIMIHFGLLKIQALPSP
jgi:hypothetical protein